MANFWCGSCGTKNTFNRMYTKSDDICIGCQRKPVWRTNDVPMDPDDIPGTVWHLSENDKTFLKSIRVDPTR